MAKIFLHIQTLTSIQREPFRSDFALAFMLGRHTKHTFMFGCPPRGSIDRGRNEAGKAALASECDYLWFLDDDMVIDWQTLDSMIKADMDIVMAHSFIRGYPFKPMCFKWKNGEQDKEVPALEYFETDEELETLADESKYVRDLPAVGFTCTLIKCDLLKKLNPPYFITNPHGGGTEDVYFCMRCKYEIKDKLIFGIDMNYPTIHMGEPVPITASTVKSLRKMEEEMNPDLLLVRDGRIDRAENYHEQCLKA